MSGYCPDCGNTLCICDEVTKATYPLRMRVLELENGYSHIDELQEAYTAEILLNGEMAERIKELEKKYDKVTTQLVSYEATIGYLKDALSKIANDRSPPWDKTDFERIARECLNGLRK
jgi:hypothetical protein